MNSLSRRRAMPRFGTALNLHRITTSFIFGLLFSFSIMGQDYTTTGLSDNWKDPLAWDCKGGPCGNNPYPSNNVNSSDITITHDLNYVSNSPINLGNRSTLRIYDGAKLNITSNLNVGEGGLLDINDGKLNIGPGVLNNLGTIILAKAVVTKAGNVVNDSEINIVNSCFIVSSGNFVNNANLSGDGNAKVENGNIDNNGNWSNDISYYAQNNTSGINGDAISEAQINENCNCILTNCDIVPGFEPEVSSEIGIIGYALQTLYDNYTPDYINPLININGSGEVLIEIIVSSGNYSQVISFLESLGIPDSNYFTDFYNSEDDQRMITVYYPISELDLLNAKTDIINQVYEVYIPEINSGLIDSQGDKAQLSNLARLGWDLTGKDITIGVISDSYDRKSGVVSSTSENVITDIENGDLPGGEKSVSVIQDFPFGVASDEGRAMLQIVHDVAPDASLVFRTGFISEGNMAAGIADLVNAGCDIIVDDITYIKAPFFQDGIIAKAVDAATNSGVKYFTSAGNFGTNSFEDTFNADAEGVRHEFSNGSSLQKLDLGTGQYMIVLQWEDDFYSLGSQTGSANDLDMYLADDLGRTTFGFNRRNMGADPVEVLPFTVLNPTTINLVIERVQGNNMPLRFKYVVFRAGDDGSYSAVPEAVSSTIIGHANAENALTVGAVRYDNTSSFGGALLAQQSSSRGGLDINGQTRNKPVLMAPTGGDTSVNLGSPDYDNNGLPNFFGTSAAAPHAAGVAALIMEAKERFGIDPLGESSAYSTENLLTTYAIDMNELGFDFVSGNGFVSATASIGSFSNPIPIITGLNLENLDTTENQPGDVEFELILEGEFFSEGSKVYLRGVELTTTYVNDSTLTVLIPEFVGNPNIMVASPPNELTNGLDGGDSNIVTFFDPIQVDVIVTAEEVNRRYGEPNPEFALLTKVGDSEEPLAQNKLDLLIDSVSFTTEALASSNTGIYAISVALEDNIALELLELYNFIVEPGVLKIDPMPVTIQPTALPSIVYGDPLPEISFDYNFGESGEEGVMVDAAVEALLRQNHELALSTVNGISLVNGISFVNGISLVNDEPTINGLSLVNKTFFVSQNTIDEAETVIENGLSLVNGDANIKLVSFGADLFSETKIDLGSYSDITNGISLINGLSLVNGTAELNGISLINGLSLVNGISYVNGLSFVNGISFVNGVSFVNGISLVNGEDQPLITAFGKILVVLSASDGQNLDVPIEIKPINVITGVNAGTQYVIPGGLLDTNFIISYKPTALVIEPAEVLVQVDDQTITYGNPSPNFTSTLTPNSEEITSLFTEDFEYSPINGCTETSIIEITNQYQLENYDVTYLPGELTFNPVELTVTITEDVFINEGDALPNDISYTVGGLICDDSAPQFSGYQVNGNPYTTSLAAGQYEITVNPESISDGYGNYYVTAVAGRLIVNPIVGCNERIKASDLCKISVTRPDFPQVTTLLRFEYTNNLDVPIYIPNGRKNELKGTAFFIGSPPEIFYPGQHTFDIYTDDGNLQWEVITNDCKKASKSANGSNANICVQTQTYLVSSTQSSRMGTSTDFKLYPNPVTEVLNINSKRGEDLLAFKLYNSLGALMLERKITDINKRSLEIDMTNFSAGILFLDLSTSEKVYRYRVIKK